MTPEEEIHRQLKGFGPEIVAVVSSTGFFEAEGPYNPLEMKVPPKAKARYIVASQEKNSRVWDIVKPYILTPAIADGILNFEENLRSRVSARLVASTAQDYMNDYAKKEGGKFITRMGQTDQKRIIDFLWANAGQNERPLARSIVKNYPQLAYLVDNNQWRLKTIKRTEVHRAVNYGELRSAIDNDFKTKTWHTAGDWRVRPEHRANAGITVPVKDRFPNGEEYPGQSSINCRCHLSYDLSTKNLTKDAARVYDTRLTDAKEDYKEAVREHTKKTTPIKKKIEKDIEPPNTAPKVEPKRVAEVKEELKKITPRKVAKLTEDEKYSVEHYVSDGFLDTNKYLRGQTGYKSREADILKNVGRLGQLPRAKAPGLVADD